MTGKLSSGLAVTNAGVPTANGNTGAWSEAITDTGVGVFTTRLLPGRGEVGGRDSVMIQSSRGVLLASQLQTISYDDVDATGIAKTNVTLREGGGGGLSVLADYDVDTLIASEANLLDNATIIGLGRITVAAGPGWDWATGCFNQLGFVETGAGDYSVPCLAAQGVDESECIMLVQANVAGATLMISAACNHVSDIVKQFTMLTEAAGGLASTRVSVDLNVAMLKIGAPSQQLQAVGRVHSMARVLANGTYAFASGAINQAAGIINPGAGDHTLAYNAGQGPDPGASCTFVGYHRPPTARLQSTTFVQTATLLQLLTRQEGVAGAVSVAADMDVDVLTLTASPQP